MTPEELSMFFNEFEVYDPVDFKITSGTKTNLRRAKSGKVWGNRVQRRDKIVLSFEKMTKENSLTIQSLLYENSSKGRELDSFLLTVPRMKSSETCSNKGFKGYVRLDMDEISFDVGPHFTGEFSLTFQVLTYEDL